MKKLIKSFKNFVNSSKNNKKSRSLLMSAFSSVLLLLSVTFVNNSVSTADKYPGSSAVSILA